MKLVDKNARRWYCKKDKTTFVASEGGWIEGPVNGRLGSDQPKSRLVAMAINLFPGGGVLYAGQPVGTIYVVLAVICVFVFPSGLLAVMAVSFIHTYVAINEHNRIVHLRGLQRVCLNASIQGNSGNALSNSAQDLVAFDFAERDHLGSSNCPKCGSEMRPSGNYCPGCGAEIPKGPSSHSDKTRLFK